MCVLHVTWITYSYMVLKAYGIQHLFFRAKSFLSFISAIWNFGFDNFRNLWTFSLFFRLVFPIFFFFCFLFLAAYWLALSISECPYLLWHSFVLCIHLAVSSGSYSVTFLFIYLCITGFCPIFFSRPSEDGWNTKCTWKIKIS